MWIGGYFLKEIKAEEIKYFSASEVVACLNMIDNTRALSRWAKIIEENTNYKFNRKTNNSRIYTVEDIERFKSADNEYSKKSFEPVSNFLIAHFSMINELENDIQNIKKTNLSNDDQKAIRDLFSNLIASNEELKNQNESLKKEIFEMKDSINNLTALIESETKSKASFFQRIFKKK